MHLKTCEKNPCSFVFAIVLEVGAKRLFIIEAFGTAECSIGLHDALFGRVRNKIDQRRRTQAFVESKSASGHHNSQTDSKGFAKRRSTFLAFFIDRKFFKRPTLNVSNTRLINRIGDKSCRAFLIEHTQLLSKRFTRKLLRKTAVFVRRFAHQRP